MSSAPDHPAPRRARWRASSSSTARPCWPARTARCSWPISGRPWSRSSRPTATGRAPGARPGWAPAGGARRPASLLPRGQPEQAVDPDRPEDGARSRGPRPAPRGRRRPRRELPGRRVRRTRVRRRRARDAQPATHPPGDQRLRPDRPGRGQARLRLRRPGRRRADVDHRRSGCRGRIADKGRGRDRRRRDGSARSGGGPGRADRPGADRDRWRRWSADRRLDPRIDPGDPRQPGPERVRDRDATGPTGNAHPSIVPYESFATADGEIAVAVGSERQWVRFCGALGVAPSRSIRGSPRTPIG